MNTITSVSICYHLRMRNLLTEEFDNLPSRKTIWIFVDFVSAKSPNLIEHTNTKHHEYHA